MDGSLIDDALDLFQRTQGAGLKVGSPKNDVVSKKIFEELEKAFTFEDVEKAEELFAEEIQGIKEKRLALQDALEKFEEEFKNILDSSNPLEL